MSSVSLGGEQSGEGIFLYGGCVSRDAFSEMGPAGAITGYVARQSLISAFNPPASLRPKPLKSSFQNRMLLGDISSDFVTKLESKMNETDVIVMDLLVERLGVSRIRGGSFVTMSSELKESGVLSTVKGQTRGIRFATEEHFRLWSEAAVRLNLFLEKHDIKSKTLVLETPWAELTDSGDKVKGNASMSPMEANEKYERYYRFLSAECGLMTYRIPEEHAIAADDHRWGTTPYHYVASAYQGIGRKVREVLGNR
jgi:hypothetical protein